MGFIKKLLFLIFISIIFLYALVPIGLRLWFPYYHREAIEFYSNQYDLDPLFVASIIRVESKFDTMAESVKGAKGLMQLMPETAEWVSQQINVPYDVQKLYEPDYNIRLGCWYLANLRNEFDNNTNLVLAAYNGGRGNVKKWIDTGVWQGDERDIDKIPFKETRDYVRRVNAAYKVYQKLYGK
ncbi:lytic transglycosylase domain-containing protein [Desulfitibacter alkalitolerans]|uniref:lytic transglycosylase domain-containing protein n=1 Tax=Desulfitibacter alkalitolerans TaxID=264641 RepID=UPI000488B931|nr:lytic transglycosylase domain-containing protein [Desulfitibacter alkalitolerans]